MDVEPPVPPGPENPNPFSLRGRPGAITLEAEGLHHPGSSRRGWPVYTPYRELTHLACSQRALWLGTTRSVFVVQRSAFVDEQGPEHLVRALLERIAALPGGADQLARMAEIEETSRLPGAPRATWALVGLCVAVYALQVFGGPGWHEVGYFSRALAADGDWWRLWTANWLHAVSAHLLLNLFALYALGTLVERSIGTARTAVVMVVSGLGAMLASGWAGEDRVVGVSGVVCGIFGALVWLELRFASVLPAWWRVPRRALGWVFGGTAALSLLPFVAGGAHAGGFLAGGAAAAALSWSSLRSRPSSPLLRAAAAVGVASCVLAAGAAVWEVQRDGPYLARYALRVAPMEGVSPEELNNLAWLIAIDDGSSRELLETARGMAERAVDETERNAPHILDTLAELHFRLGDAPAAVRIIDEAIRQDPERDYYREQRKRFLGEREGGPPNDGFFDFLPRERPLPEDEGIRV